MSAEKGQRRILLLLKLVQKCANMLKKSSVIFLFLLLGGALNVIKGQSSEAFVAEENSYEKALGLYQMEQYGNAQDLFDQSARNQAYPAEVREQAQYYGAVCAIHLYNGDVEERIADFALRHETSPLVNRLYLQYAHNLFSLKRYSRAHFYYTMVDPYRLDEDQKAEFQFKWAYSLLQQEQNEQALPLFFKLKDGESAYANSAKYYYGHILYADSNYAAALGSFLALQEDPNFGPLVPYYLAHIYYALEDFSKLVEVGEELIGTASSGRAPEIAKLLADAFYERGEYHQTIKYLELYQDKGGKMRLPDHYQLGYSFYREGRYAEAIGSFNKISRGPADLQQNAYYHLGDCYLKIGKKNQALTAFKAASDLTADPAITEDAAYQYVKLNYELASPFSDAIRSFQDFLKRYPNTGYRAKIQEYLANIYITTKDYDRALEAIKETGLKSPEMQAVYQRISFYRALEMFSALQFEGAMNKLKESQRYPKDGNLANLANYYLGETAYRLKEYEQARDYYRDFRAGMGAAASDVFDRSFYNSAYSSYKLFDFEAAAKDFRRFAKNAGDKDPRKADANIRLGDCYLLTGGYLLAVDFYQEAIALNSPESDYAYLQKSECQALIGKHAQKIATLNKLLERFPKSVYAEQAQFELGLANLQLEQYEASLQAFDRFKKRFPNSQQVAQADLKKGLIFSNTDRNAEAIGVYQQVVKDYPNTQEALEAIRLAEIVYKRQGQIGAYLDWVATIGFVDFKESTLDSTAYSAAFDQYASGDCEGALRSMDAYLMRFERGIFRYQANYYAAQCASSTGQDQRAMAYYQALAKRPGEYQVEALLYTAKQYLADSNYVEARSSYQSLLGLGLSKAKQEEAYGGLLKAAQALKDDALILSASQEITATPDLAKSLKEKARILSARIHLAREEFPQAERQFAALRQSDNGEYQAEAFYGQAFMLTQLKQHDSSNTLINEMIQALPSYKEWKMKALLLMAENFWRLDDIFQARYIIDFIVNDNSFPALVEAAKRLDERIQEAEARAIEEKEALLKAQSSPIMLDANGGIQIIDGPSFEEELEEVEIIEK